ncbi:MAG: hypothetical protein U0350_23990 [Caldilineaceae bacterium]
MTSVDAPTLLSPENGTKTTGGDAAKGATNPPLGLPTLSWAAVTGATQYQVEISASPGFATFVINPAPTTYATAYIPTIALKDGEYFWRVKAYDGKIWGPYSEVRSFTKDWSNSGTNLPQLISPPDQSTRTAFTQDDFTWMPVPGAATYLLEITTDPTFSNIIYSQKTLKTQYTPEARLQNNLYYWRVTPVDNQGNFGKPSAVQSFTFNWSAAPQLLNPAPEVDLQYVPRFAWTAVEAAKLYQLQISSNRDFSAVTSYSTPNTEYTPIKTLANDQEYFWRVKAVDDMGTSSPWSEIRHFRAKWNFQAQLLTPPNNSIDQANPLFSWTPIPGAERYQIQVDESISFKNPLMDAEVYNVTTCAFAKGKDGTIYIDKDYFWHVRGIDAQGNYTPWSTEFSFRFGSAISPNLVYPLPYYAPDSQNLPMHADRTIAWPLFVWDTAHVWDPYPLRTVKPDYYQLTVAADASFNSINFQIDTNGLGAAPTLSHPFTDLHDGQLYYWRVRAFRANQQMGVDTTWVTRLDRNVAQLPITNPLRLMYPADGFEAVDAPPVLGWQPVNGANNYHIQISTNRDFTAIVDEDQPQFVNYVPWQGHTDPLPFGSYWWRVQAESAAGVPLGDWSEARHFNLSVDLVNGNPNDLIPPLYPMSILSPTDEYAPDLTYVATSAGNGPAPYQLSNLHVMLNRVSLHANTIFDNYSWVIAFSTGAVGLDLIKYGVYVDSDHIEGSGATTDPLGKPITVDSLYLPEYVIYVDRTANTLNQILLYKWDGTSWNPTQGQALTSLGGDAWYDPASHAIQLIVPYTTLAGDKNFAGSLALTVFSTSVLANDGMFDSIPAQSGSITNPAFVSDMLTPLFPFDTPLTDPMVYYDVPPMRWRMPYFDSVDGYQVQVARDAKFTDIVETWEYSEKGVDPLFSWLPNIFQPLGAYADNESYYWRVRVRHERFSGDTLYDYGPWSPISRFKLDSRQVGNPTLSTGDLAQTTPTFSWQRVEGASGYTIQVDNDANFSSPAINEKVTSTSYTPIIALPDGNYFWRVVMRRSDKIIGHWSPTLPFVKKSVTPTLLTPIDSAGADPVQTQPTFKWSVVLTPTDQPRVAAPLYQLQVDNDPNFSSPLTFRTDATAFTLPAGKGIDQGAYYWRVAVVDANNNVGAYSAKQQFRKEYVAPGLIQPQQGDTLNNLVSFAWAPVEGAAYYEFYLGADPNNLTGPVKIDSAQYMPVSKLLPKPYYWQVRMIDADKKPGPFIQGWITTAKVFLPFVTKK